MKLLSSKDYITFNITDNQLQIQTNKIHLYFISMDQSFFLANEYVKFTVNAAYMHKFVDIMIDNTLHIEENLLINTRQFDSSTAKITLPFISLITNDHFEATNIHTKIILKNLKALNHLKGIVTYTLKDNGMILTSVVDEVMEEVYIYDVDIIINGNLNFLCSNSWVDALEVLDDQIESILLCFGDRTLMVQFLFKEYENSYFEIQVPENFNLQ